MKRLFADTFYYFALLSTSDKAHQRAAKFTNEFSGRVTTTEYILVELANTLADSPKRSRYLDLYNFLLVDPMVTIVESSPALFASGMDLYARRPDKGWSLTDCISFVVMEREGIRDALTGDRHFEQAGFNILF